MDDNCTILIPTDKVKTPSSQTYDIKNDWKFVSIVQFGINTI